MIDRLTIIFVELHDRDSFLSVLGDLLLEVLGVVVGHIGLLDTVEGFG